jgi:hypothetical protein
MEDSDENEHRKRRRLSKEEEEQFRHALLSDVGELFFAAKIGDEFLQTAVSTS